MREAVVVELGGPGMLLECDESAEVGTRLLMHVDLGAARVLQGVAVVKRCTRGEEGLYRTAVELVGLSPREISELVRETNLSAVRDARRARQDADEDRTAKRTARKGNRQPAAMP
jgi:hypothetical protein